MHKVKKRDCAVAGGGRRLGRPISFDKWFHDLHAICGHYDGVPQRGQKAVRGRIGVHAFDTLDVADVSGDVARIERDREGIRRDENEYIFFVIEMNGAMRVDHNQRFSTLTPGDCVLLDSTKEGVLHMAEASSRLMSVHLPRQTFLSDRRPGVRIGERLAGNHPVARTITGHLSRFFRKNGDGERRGNTALLFDMIHLAFTCPESGLGALELTREADRYEVGVDLIDGHLTADYLTLPWLARQLNLSERQTQRVFEKRNTSFTEVVRAKRFRYVRENLDHTPKIHGHIAEIAYRAGFQDLANFNRGFRARYGTSPRGYHQARHENAVQG
ncbi:MAG: helix-turn-helix domain-containing protein [Inquilinaceae bacterium]